jgi:Zn-dependent protease
VKWSFQIVKVAGTVIRVHVTFLLLLAGIGALFFAREGPAVAVGVLIFTGALFLCVLLHEFGHVFAARAFGIRTPDITLLPIGGVARLEKLPERPWQELVVAIAGPMVNVVIALLLLLVVGMPNPLDPVLFDFTSPVGVLQRLMVLNIWLVLFNMIPAFPMDGGRVFRALLAMTMPYAKATSIASVVGQVLAGVGVIIALTWVHPLLFLVAIFIFLAARGESEAVQTREALRDLRLGDAMMTTFQTLPREATLRHAAEALLAGPQHDFPVLERDGSLAGILTRSALIQGLNTHGPSYPVAEILIADVPPVYPATSLRSAFELLRASPFEVLPVLDSRGTTIVGLLTADNVGELLLLRGAMAHWAEQHGGATVTPRIY